ncbi:peptide-methionine (S)-S-oxide reductase MsrA [Patiriisocius hiemis]|uniref:Peptide methionine sulfoxide reductase MsrA n=1 Tax=Patiriisocius hiemis TaxID=3075604 RepID=A0ABU2YAP6_9FLAO|nr:peptide-methionine (S)-S-oxide reductase MsrA [Constantimarinum sp. W242]MDT0554921.1 peptide-methionine (S)-S-oxide reductase MsrA [Constantimarinum sp. W242]
MNKKIEQVVFAGGCFWCTEAVFQRIDGVLTVTSGYTGGHIKNPAYREVCMGITGHAEGIKIEYNAYVVSFETLLEVFFATHNPTTLNQQGNDKGTQYRSAIFYSTVEQKEASENFISLLEKNAVFDAAIVTEVTPLDVFYEATEDHQNYYNENIQQPYCQFIIAPKVEKIKKYYSDKLKKA